MEVNSTFIHANNLFGGEQNCRLESDYWHFYIFGTVSVLQVSNLEIKRCIDGTKDHQGYYADLSCKKYFIYYLKSHDWNPADGVAGSQESSKVNRIYFWQMFVQDLSYKNNVEAFKPLPESNTATLLFFCIYYKCIFYRIMFRALF